MALEGELVLIAEDDTANRALLARLLERGGYRSVGVADGRDALRAAVDERPGLILLDVGLPGLNGNVQGVVTRGNHALAVLRGWLETGRPEPSGQATEAPA